MPKSTSWSAAAVFAGVLGMSFSPVAPADQAFSAMAPALEKRAPAERLLGASQESTVRLELPPPDPARAKALRERNSLPGEKRLEIGFGRELAGLRGASGAELSWTPVAGGAVARWEVASPGAAAVRIGLEVAALPAGAQLRFAATPDAIVYGPFTAEEVQQQREYWSPVLEGERGIVEVFIPAGANPRDVRLGLSWLSHLIANPRSADLDAQAKAAGSCQVDLICLSASNSVLADLGRSVARMTFTSPQGGTALCTGTLLATSSGAGAPYFYSADHCISTQAIASTLTTHWFYDRTVCGSGVQGPSYVQLTGGATLLYRNPTSDALLLRLNSTPPAGAVYAGWSSSGMTSGTSVVGVHHPQGDFKKVSLGTYGGMSAYGGGPGVDHVIALWNGTSTGVTEQGSSGSGLFTGVGSPPMSYQLRGGLHGGPSTCTATGADLRDYYSNFALAYPNMASYLDTGSCAFSLNPASATVAAAGGGGSFSVTTGPNCAWNAYSPVTWITTSSTGMGNGTIAYTVAANTGTTRVATLTGFGGQGFQVTQAAGDSNLIQNGDFEQGATFWVQSSIGGYDVITNEAGAHGGNYDAWLGGYHLGVDTLHQDFTIPANSAMATLTFFYQVGTEDTTGVAHDTLNIAIVNPATGANLLTLGTLSNLNAGDWRVTSAIDLSAFRGQTLRLRFTSQTDSSLLTSFRIDDVRLVAEPGPLTPRLSNISTRMQVLTGSDVMIGGFVIGGTASKTVAIVATGPSLLPYGITNPLANPTLTLVRSSDQAVLASNNDWKVSPNRAQMEASGFAPPNDNEAAILTTLPPGAYTAIVQGNNATTGVAVIAVYEVGSPASPLTNISTRGRVLTGNDVMIGGFVINGSAPQTVAIVATGPSLAAYGITTPLANPALTLVRSSDQAVVATNDDWHTHASAVQLAAAGFAPSHPLEAGMYVTLQPGAYTAIVSGTGGGTGVAVVGVYKVN
jgi:lysyl endopeptidase